MQHRAQSWLFPWILCAAVIANFAATLAAQEVATPAHGVWVWKTNSLLASAGGATALRDFCRAQAINEVYLSFSHPAGADSSRSEGDRQVAELITLLHRSSIRVEALLSSTDADQPGKHREKLLDHTREVIQFNREHSKSRFDGIHLDLEPQQRPENKGPGNLGFLPNLVDAYTAVRTLAEGAGMTTNADIQNKLLKGDPAQRRMLLSSLPRLTLMLYELSSPEDGESNEAKTEKLSQASQKFMDMAYQGLVDSHLARLSIGLRMPDYGTSLPGMLKTLDNTLNGAPHYLGWAWHSYNDTLSQ